MRSEEADDREVQQKKEGITVALSSSAFSQPMLGGPPPLSSSAQVQQPSERKITPFARLREDMHTESSCSLLSHAGMQQILIILICIGGIALSQSCQASSSSPTKNTSKLTRDALACRST